MDIIMETIDEQVIKPILKRTASWTESPGGGFLGEKRHFPSRPPIPPKHVSIQEDRNNIGLTYSRFEYDRTKLKPSQGTMELIALRNAYKEHIMNSSRTMTDNNPITECDNTEMVLTEGSSCAHWVVGDPAQNLPTNEFKTGEWADTFLSMDKF